MKKSVHFLVNLVSEPIFENRKLKTRTIFNKFEDSSEYDFINNLELNDPNILILYPNRHLRTEETSVKYFTYFFNILKNMDPLTTITSEYVNYT